MNSSMVSFIVVSFVQPAKRLALLLRRLQRCVGPVGRNRTLQRGSHQTTGRSAKEAEQEAGQEAGRRLPAGQRLACLTTTAGRQELRAALLDVCQTRRELLTALGAADADAGRGLGQGRGRSGADPGEVDAAAIAEEYRPGLARP
jgi:hypothetical protein